ncbi:MAG: hypothetical protein HFE73_08880 [Firmicutes bacterium]|nr:hypothetical protein [Bacillota bacterium]
MDFCYEEMKRIVYSMKEIEEKYTEELARLKQEATGNLICCESAGTLRFLRAEGSRKEYTRRGITKDMAAIRALCRKRYLEAITKQLDCNIETLQRAMKGYKAFDFISWKEELPKAYRIQPDEFFFSGSETEEVIERWVREYVQSDYRPEGRTNLTSRGLRVRSK